MAIYTPWVYVDKPVETVDSLRRLNTLPTPLLRAPCSAGRIVAAGPDGAASPRPVFRGPHRRGASLVR